MSEMISMLSKLPTEACAIEAHGSSPTNSFLDPLSEDQQGDSYTLLNSRQLLRLIYVAAETGARSAREGAEFDPVAWLFQPRSLFDGANALTACRELAHFTNALICHGLHLNSSMSRQQLESLLASTKVQPSDSSRACHPDDLLA